MKCFDGEMYRRGRASLCCVSAFVCVCVCKRGGAEREKEDCMEKVVPGPSPEWLILFKRMKEGRVLEGEGTAGAK